VGAYVSGTNLSRLASPRLNNKIAPVISTIGSTVSRSFECLTHRREDYTGNLLQSSGTVLNFQGSSITTDVQSAFRTFQFREWGSVPLKKALIEAHFPLPVAS
jgi:hypothetical protein